MHDEGWLAGLTASGDETGPFGQLGLRDLRVVSDADGSAYVRDGRVLLTATSAGPGGFTTGHSSVWSLDPDTLELEHRADLFLRRARRPGCTATTRRTCSATATAGCWRPAPGATSTATHRPVSVTLAESTADLTRGVHVLDSRPLALPTEGFRSVGVWDPHLVRTDDGWLVGYVSATKYFRFHPALAAGPTLDALTLRAVATDHRQTEGTTHRPAGRAVAGAGQRQAAPVLPGARPRPARRRALDAAYPTNIPWPTLVDLEGQSLLIGFNGAPYGGRLVGYGSHGEVVLQRAVSP